jgi:hypothetical protein
MGRVYGMHGEMRNAHRILVGKAEGKRQLVKLRLSWEDSIKMTLK